ncbi:MAG: kynureninase [Thermonemataceae bacterium]
MKYENTRSFAQKLDKEDPIASFKAQFHIPSYNGKPVIYLCGNSLGLQPRSVSASIEKELTKWAELGVDGHFEGKTRWFDYRKSIKPLLSKIVGASPDEVVPMNNLTTNLHLMMVSFYQPIGKRSKVLMEAGAFPSDQYAVETQVAFRQLPKENIVEIAPREGEHTLRTEDILAKIEEIGETLSLVLFGGVNYYTGQALDMQRITAKAHQVGAKAGFDLAHAVGNISLVLHDWQVDFAVWCSYKYLNAGPGGVGGAFIHQKHHQANLARLGGWWGHLEEERFQMEKGFKPIPNADGWQLANEPILLMAAHRAALEIFEQAGGMQTLVKKSHLLTSFLEFIIQTTLKDQVEIITPSIPEERGCQLSLVFKQDGKRSFERLLENGIITDWREPNVIRLAPTPLYNTFEEVYQVGRILKNI